MAAPVTAWSWSRYECWAMCPLKYKFKFIDRIAEPQSSAMARGNEVHQAVARYITGQSIAVPKDAESFTWLLNEIRALPDDVKVVEQQWGFTNTWQATGWFDKNVWFRAILDVGIMYDDATFEAADWKTGKKYAANSEQVELFGASVLFRYPHVSKVATRLVYLDANDQVFDEVLGKDRAALKAKWAGRYAAMTADTTFIPRPNDKCRWCHYRKSNGGKCQFG